MADSKLISLTEDTTPDSTDYMYGVDSTGATDKRYSIANLAATFTRSQFKQTIYTPGSDITRANTSYGDIDATNLPALSLTLAVGDVVHLALTATWGYSASGNVIGVDWLVDQPVSADTNTRNGAYGAAAIELGSSETDCKTLTVESSFTATEAGAHTFKPQWRSSAAGTAAIRGGGTYYSSIRHRVMNLGPVAA